MVNPTTPSDATHFSASGLEAVTLVMSVPEFTALFGRGARRWLRTGRPTPLPGLTSDWLRQLAAGFRRGAREQIEEVVGHAARSASLPFGDERESTVRVRAKVVGRARGYIEAKLSQTIRMADVCRHAGASLRNLERFFAIELQMTPSRYIQARRLHEARRELLDPRLAHRAIGTIAYDAGFTHLGRFAGAFRARFGETPRNARAGIRSGPRGEPNW